MRVYFCILGCSCICFSWISSVSFPLQEPLRLHCFLLCLQQRPSGAVELRRPNCGSCSSFISGVWGGAAASQALSDMVGLVFVCILLLSFLSQHTEGMIVGALHVTQIICNVPVCKREPAAAAAVGLWCCFACTLRFLCSYAPSVPVLVVGDEEGRITLISIQEEEVPTYSKQEQQERLEQAFQNRANQQLGDSRARLPPH